MSRHGQPAVWQHGYYQVFVLADDERPKIFCNEFGGELMHSTARDKGKTGHNGRRAPLSPSDDGR